MNFNQIEEEHQKLEDELLQGKIALSQNDALKKLFINRIDALLSNIVEYSAKSETFEEYQELSTLSTKWSGVLSTFFEEARFIKLDAPTVKWKNSASKFLSEKEIDRIIDKQQAFITYAQMAENPPKNTENKERAEIYVASEVIEGHINFANRISSNSYPLLEKIWLKKVKELQAFYKSKEYNNSLDDKENYLYTCNHIRGVLINHDIKGLSCEFDEAKNYLLKNYIGKIDNIYQLKPHNNKDSEVHKLISHKADRVKENTKKDDKDHNWYIAETYVKMFYENIIPAVLEKSEEKTLRVLKAFQFSKANRFFMINCFETALAIYFLDEEIIKELWNKTENTERLWKKYKEQIIKELDKNYSEIEVIVKELGLTSDEDVKLDIEPDFSIKTHIKSEEIEWPKNFASKIAECHHCKKRFWVNDNGKEIGFDGVMLNVERKALLETIDKSEEIQVSKDKYKEAINELYVQSRIIHKDTTL